MAKWKLRSCPRCYGDMYTNKDMYGLFEQCLQCGYVNHLVEMVKTGQQTSNKEEKKKIVATLEKRL